MSDTITAPEPTAESAPKLTKNGSLELAITTLANRVDAFGWYAEELIHEIHKGSKSKYALDEVHVILLYQQLESLESGVKMLKESAGLSTLG